MTRLSKLIEQGNVRLNSQTNDGLCRNCRKRPGVVLFGEEGGAVAVTHGLFARWCRICVLERQLAHARERAAAIPDLVAKLREAREEDDDEPA